MDLFGANPSQANEIESWLNMINGEIKKTHACKSLFYEFDFEKDKPAASNSRFEWVAFFEIKERDPSTRPSHNSLVPDFEMMEESCDDLFQF